MVAGGVIPPQDYDFLYKAGVSAVFGPGKISLTTYKLQNDTFIVLFMNCFSEYMFLFQKEYCGV